MQFLHTTVVLP